MNLGARLQAVIELMTVILNSPRPADNEVLAFFRGRRFVGAKDRRAISDQAWRIQRQRARLTWALGTDTPDARLLVLADLVANEHKTLDGLSGLFSGTKYGPSPLLANERRMAARAGEFARRTEIPRAVKLETPEWLLPKLDAAFGADADAEIAALSTEAALDLRANTLQASRDDVMKLLDDQGHKPQPTPMSPHGLRVTARMNLGSHKEFRDGMFEVQDEASQICALLVDAKPGHAVLDLGAGAGG